MQALPAFPWCLAVVMCEAQTVADFGSNVLAGIGTGRAGLHPVQERLARAHGSQCGFCTPGFVMSMYSLLRSKTEAPTEEEIEENLAGNLWCAVHLAVGS